MNSYLEAQYRRLCQHLGSRRTAIAVAHSILVIFYHMLLMGEPYHEKRVDYFLVCDQQHIERRLVKQLQQFGYQVVPPAQAESA